MSWDEHKGHGKPRVKVNIGIFCWKSCISMKIVKIVKHGQ